MLDKLFRVHSEKNGAAMNGTASTKEGPPNGVRRALSERPTPDMLRRTDSMTAFHAQKEFQDRTVSIGNDEREYFVSGCLLLLRPAELLPAPGGRQPPAARPAAVHGQLQVYHLLNISHPTP